MSSTNHFKFGSSDISSATRGGFKVGVVGGAEYGPTSSTGFWNGVTPPAGGYTIYVDKASQGPSIHVANNDSQCIFKLKAMGATGSTIGNVLSWADGQSNILVMTSELVIGDLPGGGGGAGWYFYSDEGMLNAAPPTANGNAIFLTSGIGGDETFDPNQSGDYNLVIFFNTINSVGANFTGDFNGATEPGGIVTITQGSNVAEYSNPNGNGMRVETFGPLAGVFIIETEYCIQTQTAANSFNYNDVITLSFGGGGGRTGYYYSTTSADAVTGGTQATNVVFGYSSGDTMCNTSVISISANQFSGLTAGSYYIYDADANKVRSFTLYGSSIYGSMSGSCSTPSGGARAGFWYAVTRTAAITGGTQVGDVTFSGGSNTLCTASSAFSTSFSSLNGNIYIYNGDTGDVRTFYGSNNSSITAMSSCLNTNTPVYYYSTSSNDCYNTQTLTNVSFSGGVDFCSATGFSANELSSLAPNTYYIRDVFTDNFRSFYCAYNGSVSFSSSCSYNSCQ